MDQVPVAQLGLNATGQSVDRRLRAAALEVETQFLSEMLKSAGMGPREGSFGGGIGEEQFSSFLVDTHAEAMVRSGGIGLAESIYNALKGRENAQ